MPNFDGKDYFPVAHYEEAAEAFNWISAAILFEFARQPRTDREQIIRNFVAKANITTKSIFSLYRLGHYQDCWILYRCLLDRLFHLHALDKRDEFELFERWSFWQQYNAVNRVRSNPDLSDALQSETFRQRSEDKERARELAKDPPQWRRPDPESAAKSLGLGILYAHGYDHASTHVHPMANDGWQDFFTITKLQPAPDFPDWRSILSNTVLVGTLILIVGLKASGRKWMRLVGSSIEELQNFVGTGATDFRSTVLKLGAASRDGVRLSQRPEGAEGG
jgi:hypothetical protein